MRRPFDRISMYERCFSLPHLDFNKVTGQHTGFSEVGRCKIMPVDRSLDLIKLKITSKGLSIKYMPIKDTNQ